MKKFLLFALIINGLMSFSFKSDTDDILKALKSGSAEQVSNYFDNIIDLKLPEKDEVKNMSKNQAGFALKSFYSDNNIKSFDLTSQREMGVTMYIAGKLTNGGKGYNITLMLKKQGDKYEIITIRIN